MRATSNRVVVYIQTQQNLDQLPQCYSDLTAINVSSFHFGYDPNGTPYIHLNDNDPNDPVFGAFWNDMEQARKNGVLVIAMLGGAGGAYKTLFQNYNVFYPLFRDMLKAHDFQGVDLDVEEHVTQSDIEMLINDLKNDFPNDFYITAAPVATSLMTGYDPFSGINWLSLKGQIDWFNVQFYNGFGTLMNTSDYLMIINQGFDPLEIVAGSVTNPADGGGYVPMGVVQNTLLSLNTSFQGQIGGVMGWEYYNALDNSEQVNPPGWCAEVKLAVS